MNALLLKPEDVYRGNLILVNHAYPLKNTPVSSDLLSVEFGISSALMKKKAAVMLSEVIRSLGCHEQIVPVSGFRTAEEQRALYAESLCENGREFTEQFVALPGHSEHESGLAIDLAENRGEIDPIRPAFPYEGICGAFRRKACDYGFIERYPMGKEHITNIAHEPWHFRYVGCPHARLLQKLGLTLEEYIDRLRRYSYDGEHYGDTYDGQAFELFFVPVSHREVCVEIPDLPCQFSGNNVDGCIVTLWSDLT